MQIIYSYQEKRTDEKTFIEVCNVLDSFLTRRAVCGYEPTGLHAVFKGLFDDCGRKPTKENVIENIKKHKTVPWPSDDDFKKAVKERSIYSSGIAFYLIKEYDINLKKDVPSDKPEIEHILPQKLTNEWRMLFSNEVHQKLKDTWANLIPVSSPLNKSVRQKGFTTKRKIYKNDSMYASPRQLATQFKIWNVASLNKRARQLQIWCIKRWPY